MNQLVKFLTFLIDRIVWMAGCFTILSYARDHWPLAYRIMAAAFLLGCGVWYLWKFFAQPIRAGLKGE